MANLMDSWEEFYKTEWQHAEKDENYEYAFMCKEHYRSLVMKRLIKRYNEFHEELKMFPLLNLN